ncbi:MAG: hypothetical protein JNL96_07070 [Planctomycetaceae bacterium]|nr:hypothetical protein [Planctomycetaceae bacterium]
MRRYLQFAPALALALTLCGSARAQDLPTTNDFGITIGPDQLMAAIQESQDFWGPVRIHLTAPECSLGDPTDRAVALKFLKGVHDGLHERLFDKTEADAMDLIDYLGHRLRMFEVFRRIRTTIGDDALTAGLIQVWETEYRAIHQMPKADRGPRVAALLTNIEQQMKQGRLAEAKIAEAATLWKTQSEVVAKMAGTGAGQMMIDFEKLGTDTLTIPEGNLLLGISGAADWVLITRDPAAPIGRDEFLKAYGDLQDLRNKYATAAKETTTR